MAFDKPIKSVLPASKSSPVKAVSAITAEYEPQALQFSDFEIIQVLGEGSFGKVFKVKKRDSGAVYAMKSMSKKQLI